MQEKNRNQFDSLIEKTVGLPINAIKYQSIDEIHRQIEEKENIRLKLGQSNPSSMYYRGSMLLASGRINYDVDAEFAKAFGIKERN